MALLLFIDTSSDEGFVGLAENEVWIAQKTLSDARRFGEMLHTEAGLLMAKTGKSWKELDAVAVVSGPGSYTGLRMGMAAAKGWCFALNIPLITLNRLQLLLQQWTRENPASGKVALLLPARAGEWFGIAAEEENLLFPARHFSEETFKPEAEKHSFDHILIAGEENIVLGGEDKAEVKKTTDRLNYDSLAVTLEEGFERKSFADLVKVKPEYLKEVYINR